jgi:lipopolysaccharide biosynthesis protein
MQATNPLVKIIAFYLPQYHRIPENDAWWGIGFTDWVNVTQSRPLFPNHYQPRIPLDNNYYDLADIYNQEWQISLAKQYSIYGFCHYHYWFDGKQLLEKPTNMLISNDRLDFPFCLAWANISWTRRWNGIEYADNILQLQTHPVDESSWERHFRYLVKGWSDHRAIKVENKPIFLIYSPHTIPGLEKMLDYWRERALQSGLEGVYFIGMQQFGILTREIARALDAVVDFQPAMALFSANGCSPIMKISLAKTVFSLPRPATNLLRRIKSKFYPRIRFHSYNDIWDKILQAPDCKEFATYPGAFVDWDNTPRYGERARILLGASPGAYQRNLEKLIARVSKSENIEKLLFLNAWNEWAEGCYLEPDEMHGFSYLEATRDSLKRSIVK